MQAVIETPDFLKDAADIGLSDDDLAMIVNLIAADPLQGDLMPGTGGARKIRFPLGGKGKRGGMRTVHYYGGGDVPVFLLAIIKKGERSDLNQAHKNALREELKNLASNYRKASTERMLRHALGKK